MWLFYSITSRLIGEVPLIDLPFVMIILQAYNPIAHQGKRVPRTLLRKHSVSLFVFLCLSLSLSKTNKKVQFLLEERHGLLREDTLLVLLIFISWHKIFQFAESLKNTNRERSE